MTSSPAPLKVRVAQTAAYFLFYIGIGLILSALGPSLPSIAIQTGAPLGQLGFLFTTLSFGRLLGALWLGRLFDRIPAHPLMAAMLALICVFTAVLPVTPSLYLLAVVFFLIGLPWGVLDVGVNTLLPWIWGRRSAPVLNGLHLFFGAGAIAAPLLVNASLNVTAGIRVAYWIIAGVLCLTFVLTLTLPSPRIMVQQKHEKAQPVRGWFIAGVGLLILFCIGEEVAFGSWIFSYMLEKQLAVQDQAALLNSLYWAALFAGRLLAIILAARISARRMLWFDLAGCLVAAGTILLWPDSRLAVWGGAMLLGFSVASIFPMAIVFTGQRIALTGKVTSLLITGDAVGGMLLPWLSGLLFASIGPTAMLWKVFASFFIAAALFYALNRKPNPYLVNAK
jgi:FHS family Na+ dependent glucose MFS transporter 1